MKNSFFNFFVYFLQGASWALVVIISTFMFFHMLSYGFFIALSSAFLGSFIGLFFVGFFEILKIQIMRAKMQEEQTELLRDIVKILKKEDS